MKNNKLDLKNGFTLIELLVGIAIFALLLGALIGVFVSAIKLQKMALLEQDALNQISFSIEYIGRALRMAEKENGAFSCLLNGSSYDNPGDISSAIQFINHLQEDYCQKFFLDGNTLKYIKDIDIPEEEIALTSPDIVVEELKFQLLGELDNDDLQPRVTIFLKIGFPINIELQTTISQRNLDAQ